MEWEKVLRDVVQGSAIKELYLKRVPSLKTCDDWKKVQEIGLVDHKTKYAHYKGALVKYGERLYFVNEQRIEAIAPYRVWNFKVNIKVIDSEPGA